jgi:Holliday junction resolvase
MINSKQKGSKNERRIAKLFEVWTGYAFARTPQSGGLQWKANQSIVGDLVCTDESHARQFLFTVEAKSYREINFEHLISSNTRVKLLEFWDQAKRDSEKVDKIPLLFVRYNQMERDLHYLFMPTKFFTQISHLIGDKYGYFKYVGSTTFTVLSSKDFFVADYNLVRKLAKSYLNG